MKNRYVKIALLSLVMAFAFTAFAFASADDGHDHEWVYTVSGKTITASCSYDGCGETASVTIDTTSVYEMARNYNGGKVEYNVVRENHWHEKDGIAEYRILYYGDEVDPNTGKSTLYASALRKPVTNGNYEVRVAIFENDDPEDGKMLYSTIRVPYYLALIPIEKCTVLEWGPNELAALDVPDLVADPNGKSYYEIYNRDQFVWAMRNAGNANIRLMNDIVVNPIIVKTADRGGGVFTSTPYIYTHEGLGKSSDSENGYTGEFDGNGFTVYGLYKQNKSSEDFAGLVNILKGEGCVHDVTVENFYLFAHDAGAIAGRYVCGSEDDMDYGSYAFYKCNAMNGYIYDGSTAYAGHGSGGIVGYIYTKRDRNYDSSVCRINACNSNARVVGVLSGGIAGSADAGKVEMLTCVNYGDITGYYAGGIIGLFHIEAGNNTRSSVFMSCLNTGYVSTMKYGGGIIGFYEDERDIKLVFDGRMITGPVSMYASINTGRVYSKSNNANMGGMIGWVVGYVDVSEVIINGELEVVGNPEDYLPIQRVLNGDHARKVKVSGVKKVCEEVLHTHLAGNRWYVKKQASCTEDGLMVKKCMLCGTIVAQQSIHSTGHYYENGESCSYCGEAMPDDDLAGSIFSGNGGVVFVILIAVLMVAIASFLAVSNKKRNAAGK